MATILADGTGVLYPLIVHPSATPETRAVADELADILGQMRGLAWTRDERATVTGTGLFLGLLSEYPDAAVAAEFGDLLEIPNREVYNLTEDPTTLVLRGGLDLGVSHAAWHLASILGFRHFFMGPKWQIVPSLTTIVYDAGTFTERPGVASRFLFFPYGLGHEYLPPELVPVNGSGLLRREEGIPGDDLEAWRRHNRLAQSLVIQTSHAWQVIAGRPAFAGHPEYFAEMDGVRNQNPNTLQLCIAPAAVHTEAKQYAVDWFNANPAQEMVSMSPNDYPTHCENVDCTVFGSISDRVSLMANEVAAHCRATFPTRVPKPLVGTHRYSTWSDPPTGSGLPIDPGVVSSITRGFNLGLYSYEQLIELYGALSPAGTFTYDYYDIWAANWDLPPGRPELYTPILKSGIGSYAANNVIGLEAESSQNFGLSGRSLYLAARLLWDPDLDPAAVYADFYEKAYGPAAAVMAQYHDLLNCEVGRPGPTAWAEALSLLDQATALAAGNAPIIARIRDGKYYMHYVVRRWEWDTNPSRELLLELGRWTYRGRNRYQLHHPAMEQHWLPDRGMVYGLPEEVPPGAARPDGTGTNNKWDGQWRGPSGAYWNAGYEALPIWRLDDLGNKVDTDLTDAEVDAAFAADLAANPVLPYPKADYPLIDLVPVIFPDPAPADFWFATQSGTRYAFYSFGAPLRVTVLCGYAGMTPGDPAPRTAWKVQQIDGAGNAGAIVQQGTLETNSNLGAQEVILDVPQGAYFLEIEPLGKGQQVRALAGVYLSWAPLPGSSTPHGGGCARAYVYVPAGKTQIGLYNQTGSGTTHPLLYPDGTTAASFTTDGTVNVIAVPPGTAAHAWSYYGTELKRFAFTNCPNLFSQTAGHLLLPRSLVEADGLTLDPSMPALPDTSREEGMSTLYEKAREGFLGGDVAWDTDDIRALLVDLNDYGKVVTNATNATPIVITAAAHGFSNGDVVAIGHVGGNTNANGRFKVANATANTFELQDYNTGAPVSGNAAYTSGGYAVKTSGDLNLDDIPAPARVALSDPLIAKSITDGIADAQDVTLPAVSGDPCEAIVLLKYTGIEATSRLVAILDTGSGLPITPNGGAITIQWPASGPWGSAPGIFKL